MLVARLTSLLVALLLAIPAGALAANGVVVDPDSPAGKEYSVPLAAARGQGQGEAPTTGATSPPAFGVGIGPDDGPAGAAAGTDPPPNAVGNAGQSTRREDRAQRTARAAVVRRAAAVPTSDGAPSWPALAAVGLIVLGAGTGLVLRSRRGS